MTNENVSSVTASYEADDSTHRALRASACWQVLCEAQLTVRTLAKEAVFHGDQPIGEVSRFLDELQRAELKETYARAQLQCALDWLVSGVDLRESYHAHTTELWGAELAAKLGTWWTAAFTPYFLVKVPAHAEAVRATVETAPTGATAPEDGTAEARRR